MLTTIFKKNNFLRVLFCIITVILTLLAFKIQIDQNFLHSLPSDHKYIKNLIDFDKDFNFQNELFIVLMEKKGDIFNEGYFKKLKLLTDDVFFHPEIDRVTVSSLVTPNALYVEFVEDGLSGGTIFPSNFDYSKSGFATIKSHIIKSGLLGTLVSRDFSGSVIRAKLRRPGSITTKNSSPLSFPSDLEITLREEAAKANLDLYILGFPKLVTDLNQSFFVFIITTLITIIIIFISIFIIFQSTKLNRFIFTYSILCLIWLLGLMSLLNIPISFFSIQLTSVFFAILLIDIFLVLYSKGLIQQTKSILPVHNFFLPCVIVGAIPLYFLPMQAISCTSITIIIFSVSIFICNYFVFMPLFSLITKDATLLVLKPIYPPKSYLLLLGLILFLSYSFLANQRIQIGTSHFGTTELSKSSSYNKELALFTKQFNLGANVLTIFVNGAKDACVESPIIQNIDDLGWEIRKSNGVTSILSASYLLKHIQIILNGGNPKWFGLPRNQAALKQSLSAIDLSFGLFNFDCSIMPILIFSNTSSYHYINQVTSTAENFIKRRLLPQNTSINIGGGNIGVLAAQNDVISSSIMKFGLVFLGGLFSTLLVLFKNTKISIKIIFYLVFVTCLTVISMGIFSIALTPSSLTALSIGLGLSSGLIALLFQPKLEVFSFTIFSLANFLICCSMIPLVISEISWQMEFGATISILFLWFFVIVSLVSRKHFMLN